MQPYAGFKIVQIHFVEDSVFLDRPSPRPRDACQFCFTVALEVALFAGSLSFLGLVMRPSVDHRGGLFEQQLHESLQHAVSGVGLFCRFQRWNSNNFVSSHSSVMPIFMVQTSRREKR